jgi:hypothetical protein
MSSFFSGSQQMTPFNCVSWQILPFFEKQLQKGKEMGRREVAMGHAQGGISERGAHVQRIVTWVQEQGLFRGLFAFQFFIPVFFWVISHGLCTICTVQLIIAGRNFTKKHITVQFWNE